jgi:hypothetical protein
MNLAAIPNSVFFFIYDSNIFKTEMYLSPYFYDILFAKVVLPEPLLIYYIMDQ